MLGCVQQELPMLSSSVDIILERPIVEAVQELGAVHPRNLEITGCKGRTGRDSPRTSCCGCWPRGPLARARQRR